MPRKNRRPKRRASPSRDICYAQRLDTRAPCGRLTSNVRTSARWDEVTCTQCKNG